ncbi:MAG TPA: TIGR04133 family radical SAM/SPASM protein [Bacteroidales bacterium]|nr:TIGR04133 family radical SAM/SPASM protein [Bacteroidales bacterium]
MKLRRKLALRLHSHYVKTQAKLHTLNYFFWECTAQCNLACLHCGSDCKVQPSIANMPAEDFLNVARQVASHYDPAGVMVVITGGEPLMRNDLHEVGAELMKLGFAWGMVSNGYLFTPEKFRLLRNNGLRSVTISLDGLEESHDWMRGKQGSFEKAMNAIRILAAEPGMTYDVVTCVNQRNFGELEQISQLLAEAGVKRWRLFMIDPIGRAAENSELFLSGEQFRRLLNYIVTLRREGNMAVSYGCDGYLGVYETHVRDGFFFCRAGIHVASVLANGDISACPNIDRGFVQGNIYTDDFIDVWNTRFQIFRNRTQLKQGVCSHCKEWKHCWGDGMHLHHPGGKGPVVCYHHKLSGNG